MASRTSTNNHRVVRRTACGSQRGVSYPVELKVRRRTVVDRGRLNICRGVSFVYISQVYTSLERLLPRVGNEILAAPETQFVEDAMQVHLQRSLGDE